MSPQVISNSPEREDYKHIMFSIIAKLFIEYWELDKSKYPEMRDAVWDHFILYGIPNIGKPIGFLADILGEEE